MKEKLYHFTSVEALMSMLSKYSAEHPYLTLWATHIKFLNDSSEYQYGLQICQKYANKYNQDFCEEGVGLSLSLSTTERPFDAKLDPYVISFSKVCDTASMWAMYSRNGTGIAISFNRDELKKQEVSFKKSLLPCLYLENEDQLLPYREVILNSFKLYYDGYSSDGNVCSQEALRRVLSIHNALQPFFPAIKHPAFEYEQEVRLVYREDEVPSYRLSNGHLCPYKEVQIPVDAIEGIILGPALTSKLDREALRMFLSDKGLIELSKNIVISQVPYR